MTKYDDSVNTGLQHVLPLRNVTKLAELLLRVKGRAAGLPGMGCFYGPSGYGKSFAAIYAANSARAYHVQVKSIWGAKYLCQAILQDMGMTAAGTIPAMVDQIGRQLALSQRPLLIDEADFLVGKRMIEVIRDIYESSQATIILIGEEQLPHKLKVWERVHGRMLDWVAAEPASLADSTHLAGLYCRGIVVSKDLLEALHKESAASVRRICVNLEKVREIAESADLQAIDLAAWRKLSGEFFTGNPPARRVM